MKSWTTKADVTVGQTLNSGTYKGARVDKIGANGWLWCTWPDGRVFTARVHWLDLEK